MSIENKLKELIPKVKRIGKLFVLPNKRAYLDEWPAKKARIKTDQFSDNLQTALLEEGYKDKMFQEYQ